MDIRGTEKQIKKLKKIKTKVKDLSFNADDNVEIPVIMVSVDGKLVEYLKGCKEIKSFLIYGYNRIIKQCPYRHRKCIGEKCSLYIVHNGTGDCSHVWNFFKG